MSTLALSLPRCACCQRTFARGERRYQGGVICSRGIAWFLMCEVCLEKMRSDFDTAHAFHLEARAQLRVAFGDAGTLQ